MLTTQLAGDAISIDILLRHGASPDATDNGHLTPLHWASIKASRPCVQRLVSAGADLGARDENGKTARDMADEMKVLEAYRLGLQDAGYALDGFRIQPFLDQVRSVFTVLPLTTHPYRLPVVEADTVCHPARPNRFPWRNVCRFRLPPAIRWPSIRDRTVFRNAPCTYPSHLGSSRRLTTAFNQIVTRTLLRTKGFGDTVSSSPYFAAVIIASMVFVGGTWLTFLLTGMSFIPLMFALPQTKCHDAEPLRNPPYNRPQCGIYRGLFRMRVLLLPGDHARSRIQ